MNRRQFVKLASTVTLAAPSRVFAKSKKASTPNIVLIFIDDMGWRDTTYNGSDLYETPNIDGLSKQGVVFSDAYACAGNCAPSRACLISGQYTPRHGIYAVYHTKRGPVNHMRVEPVPNTSDLAPANITIAEAMKSAGYATGMFGKWHLGKDDNVLPKAQGFDVDDNIDPPKTSTFKETDDPKWIYKITKGACDFMEDNKDKPFFCYVSHHATHMGIQAREEMYDRFGKKEEGDLHKNKKFAAMNAQMDDGVGMVLDKIKSLGIEDNTLVVFTSDNGGLPQSSQQPLRGFKGMYYEGGIRVPMIARWPGVIKPGTKCDTPVVNVDLYPTFLDVANGKAVKGKALDGRSLVRLFKGQKDPKDVPVFWHFPGYLDRPNPGSRDNTFRARPVTVVRKGDWKLHLFHEEWSLDGGKSKIDSNNCVELYNLAEDISEKKDLSLSNKGKRDELVAEVLAWIEKTGAKLASEANP